jgi:CheY-like chemotaxis protein
MPKTDGFDVLATLQSLPEVALPVVVLSTSTLAIDVQMAKKLGAMDYLMKPVDQDEMLKVVLSLHERWLGDLAVKKEEAGGFASRKSNLR